MTVLLPSCNRHGLLAARLASERSDSVIRLSKAFAHPVVRIVKAAVIAAWCARSAPTLSSLSLHPEATTSIVGVDTHQRLQHSDSAKL